MSVTSTEAQPLDVPAQTVNQKPEEAAAWLAAIVASSFDAIVGKTLDGTVTSWNKAAAKLFGYSEEEMIGQSIRRVIPEDRQTEEDHILAQVAAGECVEHYVTVRRHKDGDLIDVSVTVSPVHGAAGTIIGASKIARDITRCKRIEDLQHEQDLREREGTEQALYATRQRLAAILEALPVGVALVDTQGRVQIGNDVFKRFVPGIAPARDDAAYKLWEGYDHGGRRLERSDFPGARALRGERVWPGTELLFHGDESRGPIWTRVATAPFRGEDGAIIGATAVIVDIDEEKRARDALAESELRMRLAQEAAHAGVWEWRLADNRNQWSDSLWTLYGLDIEQHKPSFEAWAASIHPGDHERVTSAVSAAAAAGQEIEVQWRVKRPEGEPERWLLARGNPIVGTNGTPERYIGIVLDITERKRMEEALQAAKERKSFLLALSDALRGISDPAEIMATASELLGRKLGAGKIAYADVDAAGEYATISRDWTDGTIPSNTSTHRLGDFGAAFIADLKQGKTVVIADVRADPRTSTPEARAKFEGLPIRSLIDVPLVKAGRLVAILAVHMRTPRAWRQDEVALVQEVAERTWDAVERARAEQALRESEERLRFSLKGAGAAAWQYDILKDEQIWSPESYELHGRDPALGKPRHQDWLECLHPEDRARVENLAFRAIEKGSAEYRTEYRVVFPSGEVRWLDALGKVDYAEDGTALRLSGINLDITERKRAEASLREAEEFQRQKSEELETILAAIPTAVIIAKGADCVEMIGNRAVYELLRLSPEMSLSKSAPPERASKNYEVFLEGQCLSPGELPIQKAAATKNAVLGAELEIRFVEGDSKFVLANALPLFDDAGEVRGAVGAFTDVTHLKRVEAALRESGERLKFALEAAGAGTWEAVPATGEFIASDRALALHGAPPGTPMSHEKAMATVHPEDRPRVLETLRHAIETGEPYRVEMRMPLPDGSIRWVELRGEPRTVAGRQVLAGLLQDITERKRNEEALRESEEWLRFSLKGAGAAAWQWDILAKELVWSPECYKLHGLDPQLGKPGYQDWLQCLHPDDRASAEKTNFDAVAKGVSEYQTEYRVVHPSGEVRWLDARGRVDYAADGSPISMSGINLDITERKRNEETLASARRLEAVGQLAGGVAHDFNNLLAVIAGNLELAENRIIDQTARQLIRTALDAAEKGSGLNRRLLSLARKRALEPKCLSLNGRVDETAKLLLSTLGDHIAVSTDLAADLWMTRADPGEIDSAILNIAANARDAMPNGGRIEIATRNVTLDAAAAAELHTDAQPGEYVRLAVADNGVGVPQEILEKVMEPFFTTKGPGAGTGLGLTSVGSFAKQAAGFITLASEPGNGCIVSIYLPRTLEELPASPTQAVPLGDGELVLVVEDDDQVREVTLRRIESLGYTVAEARTGSEAVEQLRTSELVQLVLSDTVMLGGMTGYDVARWVASNKPEIKVILCSGYNEGDRGGAPRPIRDVIVLNKPYSRDQLARALACAIAPS